ncbi:hypothetical protein LSAT2_009617 [Lamellibrachia satsuma]|nr:hypothetical protein LSAT2_009617 [Lamellibrachia satsuma]
MYFVVVTLTRIPSHVETDRVSQHLVLWKKKSDITCQIVEPNSGVSSCGLRLNLLEAGVYPMDAHRQLSPECPLAVSQQSAPMVEDTAQALSASGAPEQVSTNEVNSQTASLGSTMAVQSISRETNNVASSRGPQRYNRHHRHGHNRRQNHNSQVASFIGGNNRSMHYRSLPPVPPFTSLTVLGPISGHGTGDSSVDMLEIDSLSLRDSLLANNNSPRRMMERINNNDPSLLDEMRYERCRVDTYSNWPRDTNIEPEALAQAGLFYLYRADRVKCAFCYGILRNWESSEDPTRKHRRLFPTCSFLRNPRAAGNVALGEELTEEQTQHEPSQGRLCICTRVKHANMVVDEVRLATFNTWPSNSRVTKETLAHAGFFFSGNGICCFSCGGILRIWQISQGDPVTEHHRLNPGCDFLRQAEIQVTGCGWGTQGGREGTREKGTGDCSNWFVDSSSWAETLLLLNQHGTFKLMSRVCMDADV